MILVLILPWAVILALLIICLVLGALKARRDVPRAATLEGGWSHLRRR